MLRGFQNFDALATGTLPVGWTNGSGGNFIVGTNRPSSGSKCLSQSASVENIVCTWSAVSSVAGNIAAQLSSVITVSGNTSSATNLLVASDTAGTTGYVIALVYNAGWVLQFFKSSGASAWNFISQAAAGFTPVDGNIVNLKFDVNGTAIKSKVWLASTSEPASWTISYTDASPVAVKYAGVYAGSNGLAGVIVNADNIYVGDSGDSFSYSTVAVTDPNLYFSHRNTFSDGTGSRSASNVNALSSYALGLEAGWYVKGGFSGTSCYLWLDTTALGAASAGDCPRIKTKIDETPFVTSQLVAGSTIVPLATALAAGNHTFKTTYYDSNPNNDQWVTPIGVKVLGFLVDSGAASATAPTILAKRLTYHSDSIGRGYCTDSTGNNGGDATHATPWMIASALGAELGNVSYGGQGWGHSGQGNVPAFFVPGSDSTSAWNKLFSGQSALVNGLESPTPDDIVVQLGTNDYLNSVSDATVTASVAGYLAAQRAAAPTSRIWVVLPFGGFKKSAIIAGYTQYAGTVTTQTTANGLGTFYSTTTDPNAFLIDLGSDATTGLTDPSTATTEAPFDGTGIHPSLARNAQLAAQLSAAIARHVPASPNASTVNAYTYCYDANGNYEVGKAVSYKMIAPPSKTIGAWDSSTYTTSSDNTGLVQITMVVGATYQYQVGSGPWQTVAIAQTAPNPYQLPEVTS